MFNSLQEVYRQFARNLMPQRTFQTHLDGPGLFDVEVVGESQYQDSIQMILQFAQPSGPSYRIAHQATARLVSDLTNKHDPNAIQVLIQGLLVGFLDRSTAATIRKQLYNLGYGAFDATCSALILGGFNEELGDDLYGVKLDIARESQRNREAQFNGVSEMTFFVESPERSVDESLAYVGNGVNFWSAPDMPSRIHIYCRGGIGGEGKLGLVPADYVAPIRRHLSAGLEFDAKIIAKSDRWWQIQCRLVPAEETAQRIAEYSQKRRERLQKELAKPYRPKKAIEFIIHANRTCLSRGDELQVVALPTIEDIVTQYGPQRVLFRCVRSGKELEQSCQSDLAHKLIRLSTERKPLTAKVKAKGRARQDTVDFTIEIPPSH